MVARASKLKFHPKSMNSRIGDIVFEGFLRLRQKVCENFKIDKNSTSFITDFIERGLLQQCVIPGCKLNKEAATEALKKYFIKPSGLVVSTRLAQPLRGSRGSERRLVFTQIRGEFDCPEVQAWQLHPLRALRS